MTSLVLGQNIPLYHTYNQETQDTRFAVPNHEQARRQVVARARLLLVKGFVQMLSNQRE
jgi:hypothetical protein